MLLVPVFFVSSQFNKLVNVILTQLFLRRPFFGRLTSGLSFLMSLLFQLAFYKTLKEFGNRVNGNLTKSA